VHQRLPHRVPRVAPLLEKKDVLYPVKPKIMK
jgi:hypothetical protein